MHFDDDRVNYHIAIWEWLLTNFGGIDALRQRKAVLPLRSDFPVTPGLDHRYASDILGVVKEYMGLTHWPCQFEAYSDGKSSNNPPLEFTPVQESFAAGTFQWSEDTAEIRYQATLCADFHGLVATLAHELCHYLLATATTAPPGGLLLHEIHTDVACGFMGFGVFSANSAFRFSQWTDTNYAGWSTTKQGYLSASEHAYSLALFCILSGADTGPVRECLSTNPRNYFEAALEDIAQRPEALQRLTSIVGNPILQVPPAVRPEPVDQPLSPIEYAPPSLTLQDLEGLRFVECAREPIWNFYLGLLEQQVCEDEAEAEFQALRQLPELLRHVVLIVRFDVLVASYGIKNAIDLGDDLARAKSETMLKLTAAALHFIGDAESSAFLFALVPKLHEHFALVSGDNDADSEAELLSPLWVDEDWKVLNSPYIHLLRRLVRDRAAELVF